MRVRPQTLILTIAGMLVPAIVAFAAPSGAVLVPPPTGSLSISAPPSSDLGSGVTGGTIRAELGTVSVTDTRSGILAGWAATVSAAPFTTGGATPAETIGLQHVRYWSGAATATSGVGTFVPGQLTEALAQTLEEPRLAFTVTATGGTSASWTPRVVVDVPASAALGTYSGTITHSVA